MFKHLPSTKSLSLLALPLLVLIGVLFLSPTKVYAASLTVDSILDTSDDTAGDGSCDDGSGNCTLRAAIEEANALAGADTINFGIAGSGVHTFTPGSSYDTISEELTIDGYSQPGSSANSAVSPNPFNGTLTIEIDGTNAGGSSRGLNIQNDNVAIKGLVINRFGEEGVAIGNFSNIRIEGNYIGIDPTGLIDRGNTGSGIDHGSTGTDVVVGGTTAAARNVISGNEGNAIAINSNLLVQGNYFGLNASGDGIIANVGGGPGANLYVVGDGNVIGGSTASTKNVNAGSSVGILIFFDASSNVVQGNYVGTNVSGNAQSGFGNTVAAIAIIGGQDNLIGGTAEGEGNLIAGNASGVMVGDFFELYLARNNSILGNSIYDNSGGTLTNLGIDLLGDTSDGAIYTHAGVTPNDTGDSDEASNHLMNFPVISSVSSSNGQVTITYSLDINDSEPGATGYRVEFFANDSADPSGHGQGQTFIGSDTIAGDVTNRSVTIDLPSGVSGPKYISSTTTMTDASDDGFGHTSEFSLNVLATLVAGDPDSDVGDSDSDSSSSESLADTGQNTYTYYLVGIVLLIGSGVLLKRQSKLL
ncbi:MAG TPA: LPXTG cell wall anchor domain-containing protein [Candidatus Saccharibacteria bacterium]|nr:LPXTG cell wall anchor domain-containing protein [Candidatus Saccharibacteria bacterium]